MFDSGALGTSVVSDLNPYEQLIWQCTLGGEKTELGGLSQLLGGSFLPRSPFRDFPCCDWLQHGRVGWEQELLSAVLLPASVSPPVQWAPIR